MDIELQNNNVEISINTDDTNININNNNQDIEISEEELNIEVRNNPVDLELGVCTITLPDRNHYTLYNLDYEHSGHTGFQEEMNTITNIEIERMWNSI